MTEKERYATIGTWVRVFREEGVEVRDAFVRNRLKIAGVIGETGRERSGRLCLDGFFREMDVRRVMAHLLDPSLINEEEDGYAYRDGIRYMNIHKFIVKHEASIWALQALIETAQLQAVKGRSKAHLADYYPEEVLLNLWQNYVKLPSANDQDVIESSDESFCTVYGLSKTLSVSEYAVTTVIERHTLMPIEGRDQQNVKRLYYPLNRIRKLLESLPKEFECDADGFVEIEGLRCASLKTWCRVTECAIDPRTIQKKLDQLGVPGRTAIDQTKVPRAGCYYSEADFKQVVTAHSTAVQTDKNGYAEVAGKQYMTALAYCNLHGLSEITSRKRLKNRKIAFLQGRNELGHAVSLYTDEQLSGCLGDLLSECPRADADGFVVVNGERYSTLQKLVPYLEIKIDFRTARNILKQKGVEGIDGHIASGRLLKKSFFRESDVRSLISSPVETVLIADEKGFLELGGKRYGSMEALAICFGVSWNKIKRTVRRNDVEFVEGRHRFGSVSKYYSESVVQLLLNESRSNDR